jgi:hypothetical protein
MKITKTGLLLLIIFILAFILRIIAANNTHVSSDEMVYSVISLNIISANKLGTIIQHPVYSYLADIGYNLSGGITAISTRLPAIVWGSLAIFIIFLLSMQLFDRKAGIISALLFSVSGYAITHNYEPDMVSFFFVAFSILFLIRSFKKGHHNLYYSSIFLAISVLVKPITLTLIPAYLYFIIVNRKKGKESLNFEIKKNVHSEKKIGWGVSKNKWLKSHKLSENQKIFRFFIIAVIIFIMAISPVIIYNYFAYQDNHVTDILFYSNGIGDESEVNKKNYVGLENESWKISKLFETLKELSKKNFVLDSMLLIFGLVGIYVSFKNEKNKSVLILLILSCLFLVGYVGGITSSDSHFIWITVVLSIFAGKGVLMVYGKLKNNKKLKFKLKFIFFALLILNTYFFMNNILESRNTSTTLILRDYVQENIPNDAIIILDPRIYDGINAWVFNDKHYMNGAFFFQFLIDLEQFGEIPEKEFEIYYLECVEGNYCGWKPEDYENSYEYGKFITNEMKNILNFVTEIKSEHNFRVYSGKMSLPYETIKVIDRNKKLWMYSIGWKHIEDNIDNYETKGFGTLVNGFGYLMLYLNIFIALISIPLIFYLVYMG